ncbi:transporter substrate-binding domain-containing protein [Pseudidiomarina taiwanensis]|nr:transporter substrate-binding domain-containing protein [Pseudidiomarina taiwanensis]
MRQLITALLFCLTMPSMAQPAEPLREPLEIGVRVSPPFVIKEGPALYSGLTIELFEHIAAQNGLDYRYHEVDDIGELFDRVSTGDYAMGLGALSVTADREAQVDFTQPFYNAGLAIAVPNRGESNWWYVLKRFVSLEFLSVMLALFAILLLAGWALWLFERRRNSEQFSEAYGRGIGAGFWWAAVTMTTVGYGDKSPITLGGRIVSFIWMFTSVIIISSFTASITSSLTVGQLSHKVEGPRDLPNVRVASVPNSYSATWLARENIGYQQQQSLFAALTQVDSGRADAVVYDAPLLQYQIRQQNLDLTVLEKRFAPQDYALALPQGSAMREQLNRELLRYIRTAEWRALVNQYLGEEL